MTSPALPDFCQPAALWAHMRHTLAFYAPRVMDPSGGCFQFFKDNGQIYDRRTRHLVSSTRFVFNHALAWRWFGARASAVPMMTKTLTGTKSITGN